MRLTKQTNHAIRILMYCAANDPQLSKTADIARAYRLSELFLFKVLQPLSKAGLMQTVRGRNGGLRLGRAADQITLFDVIKATEGSFCMTYCLDRGEGECLLINNCSLDSAFHNALNTFFDALSGYTIENLVAGRPQIGNVLGLKGLHDPGFVSGCS